MFLIFSVDSVWWFYFFIAFRKSEMQNKIFHPKSNDSQNQKSDSAETFCWVSVKQKFLKQRINLSSCFYCFVSIFHLELIEMDKIYDIFHLPNMSEIVECFVCELKHKYKFLSMTIKIINIFATCIKFVIFKGNSWNLVLCEMREFKLSDFHTKQSKQ